MRIKITGIFYGKITCIYCGSDKVEQTADHCSHGYNGYRCLDCGREWGN